MTLSINYNKFWLIKLILSLAMGKNTCCCKNKPDPQALEQQDDERFLNDTNIPSKLTKEERKRQQDEVNAIEEETP